MTSMSQPVISRADAAACLAAAEKHAAELGIPVSVAVVDSAGTLKAFARADGASLLSVAVSQRKAYTAAAIGVATDALYEAFHSDPALLMLIGGQPGLALIGGGVPIHESTHLIGAVGAAGGSKEQDAEIAAAGAAALST